MRQLRLIWVLIVLIAFALAPPLGAQGRTGAADDTGMAGPQSGLARTGGSGDVRSSRVSTGCRFLDIADRATDGLWSIEVAPVHPGDPRLSPRDTQSGVSPNFPEVAPVHPGDPRLLPTPATEPKTCIPEVAPVYPGDPRLTQD